MKHVTTFFRSNCRQAFFYAGLLILPTAFISCSSSSRFAKLHDVKAEEVYSRVAENYRRLHTFSGNGKIIIETPELQYAGTVHVVARPPDSLIVKIEGAFGVDVGFFFANRARFASYAPLENTYYTGRTSDAPELVFFHIDVSFEEIMSEMIGAVVPPFDSSFAMQADGDDLRFDGKRGHYHLTYWVDAEKFVVKRGVLIDAKNRIAGKQEFSRFRKKNGVWLPQLIRAESRPAGAQQRLTIFYERINPGSKVTPEMFTFKVPANAKLVDLSAEASKDGNERR